MTSFYTPDGYVATATYDAENRLKTVTYTGHSYTFYYNGDGMLARQVIDGTDTRFVRDGYLCLQERNSSNAVTNAYAWDPDAPGGIGGLLELKSGTNYYSYLYDGRGDVTALLNSLQAAGATYKYDPALGRTITGSGSITRRSGSG